MSQVRRNPVYRAVNKPMTVGGVERKMVGIVMIASLLVLIAFGMTAAALMFGTLFFAARLATKEDPRLPQIILGARRFRLWYDPVKRDYCEGR